MILEIIPCKVDQYLESLGLHRLTLKEQVLKLKEQYDLLFFEASHCQRMDYLIFGGCETLLFNVFFARLFLYGANEEAELLECVFLREKLNRVIDLLEKALANMSFPMADFLSGERNVAFYDLNRRPTNTPIREYYQMKRFQVQKKKECFDLEFGLVRNQFVMMALSSPSPMDSVRQEINLLEEVLGTGNQLSADQLFGKLSRLRGLLPGGLPDDKAGFHDQFFQFTQGTSFPYDFSPPMLSCALEHIHLGKIPGVPLFCLIVEKYKKWLTDVRDQKADLNASPDLDYEGLFYRRMEKYRMEVHTLIGGLQKKHRAGSMKPKEYEKWVKTEARKHRLKLNALQDTTYYQLLLNIENTKDHFIDQCLHHTDIDNEVRQLHEAFVLSEMIRFFMGEINRMGLHRMDLAKMKALISNIISTMIPDAATCERLYGAVSRTSTDQPVRKPTYFVEENLKDAVEDVFSRTCENLELLMLTLAGDLSLTFANSQLLEYRLRASKARKNNWEKPYFDALVRQFEIYVEYFKNQQLCIPVSCLPVLYEQPILEQPVLESPIPKNPLPEIKTEKIKKEKIIKEKIKKEEVKILAFNLTTLKDDRYLAVMNYLIKNDAIPNETTMAHFKSKFDNINGTDPIEWLAAQADFATFIKEVKRIAEPEFAPYNQHWDIACVCFVQKGGIPFDPQKLRCSKPTMQAPKFIKAAGRFK